MTIHQYIEDTFGKSLAEISMASKKQSVDQDGLFEPIQIEPGLSVRYISNPNYSGGRMNGFGDGVYATIRKRGYTRNILLTR